MSASFFFYDLETSGFSAHGARIMQFAGIRTDLDLTPVGDPVDLMIKLPPDVLPDPDAIMLTGITPQQTIMDGLTEAEFLTYFYQEVVQPDTTFVGFNSIRFDDEFMRYLHYRNFYDPYEWQWSQGCSRWDVLDLVRMTRALRPEGIVWPMTADGKPTNRLELLTKENNLSHEHAHDALSDVYATIAVAKLIKDKQPDLFTYLYDCRNKKVVSELILKKAPFIYTSGRYSSAHLNTSAAVLLTKHPQQDSAIVYDLRVDPTPFLAMSSQQLVDAWRYTRDPEAIRLPVKTLKFNRCPAVAPMGVVKETATQERLSLDLQHIVRNLQVLQADASFAPRILDAIKRMDAEREAQRSHVVNDVTTVDSRLYDSFLPQGDKAIAKAIRTAEPDSFSQLGAQLGDTRLQQLLPLYKARNFPASLSSEELAAWDAYRTQKLFAGGRKSQLALFFDRLAVLASEPLDDSKKFLLEELQLYGQSIMPGDVIEE
jgi:exodeoxyribonuclease-1